MKDRYTAFYEETVATSFSVRRWGSLVACLLLFVLSSSPANAQCTLDIESVLVNCNYDNGNNIFEAEVTVSWTAAPGSSIRVTAGGQSREFTPLAESGTHTFTGFTLPSPGMGYPVIASFTDVNNYPCEGFGAADAVACTPACSGDADGLGGFAWKDTVADGLYDEEPGQPNVRVEVYDCEGVLQGTAFTNGEGRWSVSGLNPGEEYRVEFSTLSIPGISPSLAGADNGSPVQFATAGDCAVNAGFMDQGGQDCYGDEDGAGCSGSSNTLDWSAYSHGANPFPLAPFSASINGDEVFWARTTEGATPYAHRVYHSALGGAEAFYLLETESGGVGSEAGNGVGVVLAFGRPVAGLSFSLLDIGLAGGAAERAAVQAYVGGAPVNLSLSEITAGSAVAVLNPYLFEGNTEVGASSTEGNVTISFDEPVDQLAITLFSAASAGGAPVAQSIGLGNISWCAEPAPLLPGCTRIFDWLEFSDNEDGPTPFTIDGVELNLSNNDPFGIGSTSSFAVDNDYTPLGGQRGFWAIGMNATAPGQYVESSITFSEPVSQLRFSILDIGRRDGQGLAYQDRVEVRGFLQGEEAPLGLSDLTVGAFGGSVSILSPNEYQGDGGAPNGASADGNISVSFPGTVDSVAIRLAAGPDGPSNPAAQQVGLSGLSFCICPPPPLQIGDLVWEDVNGNGVQEACEPPLANLLITLYDEAGAPLATTRSNSLGRYHFTRPGTDGENWFASKGLQPNTAYILVFGSEDSSPGNGFILIDEEFLGPTARLAGIGSNPYLNDSDAGPENITAGMPGLIPDGMPYIRFSTGNAGQANPTLDAGFTQPTFDLALRLMLNEGLSSPPFLPGEQVNYTITVYNQGTLAADAVGVAVFYPDDVLALEDNGNWAVSDGALHNQGPLPAIPPGDSLSLGIAFRIDPAFTGDTIITSAEIFRAVNFLGIEEEDSTPDLIPDNDAGGAPGSEADDAIMGDGTGPVNGTEAATDEDDHDVALIVADGLPEFDLSLNLYLNGDGPFYPGDEATFTIEVVNEGALDAEEIQLNNYIPNGLLLNDPEWTRAGGVARLNTPIETLPAGSSVLLEITFMVEMGFPHGAITNVVEIASAANATGESDGDSTPANQEPAEDDQAAVEVYLSEVFDLSLRKELVSPGPFFPGDVVNFSIRITNEGSVPARNVQITDFIPEGLILNHNSWSDDDDVARLNNPIPNIAPGNTVNRQIIFVIDDGFDGASITNAAEIYSAVSPPGLNDRDSTPRNNSTTEDDDDSATFVVQQPTYIFDLAIRKQVNYEETPGPFAPGSYITYSITVINEGNIQARNIQVADYLPDGTTLADDRWVSYGDIAVLRSTISSLEGGASATVTIRLRIDDDFDEDEIENHVEIYFASNNAGLEDIDSVIGSGIGDHQDDEAAAITPVQQDPPSFDLSLTHRVKTSVTPGPFYPGSTVTFTIRVSNEGTVDANTVSIVDYIPPGLELADANWSQVFSTAVLNTPITGLAAGASASVDITFRVAGSFTGTLINNTVEINSAGNALAMPDEDSTPANGMPGEDDISRVGLAIVQTYDLALSKTLNTALTPGPYQPGGQVAFNLTVFNQGSLTASNIRLYDYYPPGLILNDGNWEAVQGNILRLATPISTLAPGQSITVSILFDISPDAEHGDNLVNCAELGSSTNSAGLPDVDSTPANGSHDEDDDDTETVRITAPRRFDLALSKTVDMERTPGPYYPGGAVSYRIVVKNEGEEEAYNIQLQDYIPQGLILTSSDWSALGSVAMLNNPIPSLSPGDSAVVGITFAVSPIFQGTALTNYAEVAGSNNSANLNDADSTPGNGSAGPGEDDFDGATITVIRREFDLALRKRLKSSATPGPFFPGSAVTFEIEIFNEGNITAQNIQLREYFPQGLLLTDPDWNAVGNVAELAFPIGSLEPGAAVTVDVTFTVAAGFGPATLTNYAEVGSAFNILGYDDMDSTPGNGSLGENEDDFDSAIITVLEQNFDLRLSKELKVSATPGPFVPGSTVTFRITATNEGDLEAQNVQLRDYIPLGLALADINWTQNGSMAVRNIGNLPPGASASYDITFTVSSAFAGSSLVNYAEIGAATNSAGIQDSDSTPGNGPAGPGEDDYDGASISIIQEEFDLALAKELNTALTPGPFVPGSTVTYRLTLTNEGDAAAQNIQVLDYIPLGLILTDNNWASNGNIASRTISNLAPGASATLNITFAIATNFVGTAIANYAEIGSAANIYGLDDRDSTPGNGSSGAGEDDFDGAVIDVIQQPFDLALAKEINASATPGPFYPGSTITYRITVTNEGGIAAQSIQVRDYIPLGLVLADNNWTLNGSMALRNIGSLQPGASTSVDITFTISPIFSGLFITNYAEIGAATNAPGLGDTDSTPANGSAGFNEDDFDSAGTTVNPAQQFDLTLRKEVSPSTPGPYFAGSPVTFRLTVTNQGNVAAQAIQLWDYLPAGLTLSDNTWTASGAIASYNSPIASLAPGNSHTVEIDFIVGQGFGGTQVVNYAEIGAAFNGAGLNDVDSTPGNGASGAGEDDYDDSRIDIGILPQFDLALSKSVSPSTPEPYYEGSAVTFLLTVANEGGVEAQNIQLWDYLPPGLVLSDNAWTANGGVASLNSPIASLAPGASQTVEIDFVVAQGFGGTMAVNYAEIGAAFNGSGLNDADSTPGNGSSGPDEDDYDNAAIEIKVPPQFDLALAKEVSSSTPGPYHPGSPVTFLLTVTNQGNVMGQNIQVWDYLPLGLTLSDNNWTANGGVASYNTPIANLAPGASQVVEINFVVDQGFGGAVITNFAEIFSAANGQGLDDADSTPGNGASGGNEDDFDSAAITISPAPRFDLALRKQLKTSATPGPFFPGSPAVFRITVANQGNMDAYRVEVTDYIPSGLVLSDANWAQSGATATRVIPGPIPPGGTAVLDISFVVEPGFTGNSIINFAEISAADDDTDPGNTPPDDADSQFDNDSSNDAGGMANSPSDDAMNGNGTGQPGSTLAATDEDDHDPALIFVGSCPAAGADGVVEECLNCTTDNVYIDLAGALGGNPSPGGAWADLDGAGVSLSSPSNVNFAGVAGGEYRFRYTVGGQNGCPVSTAVVTVSLSSNLDYACDASVNVSLGSRCEVRVIPSMVLEGEFDACIGGLEINLIGPGGQSLGNTATTAQAGQTLIAEVIDPDCGVVCWGNVNVQDFTPPSIACPVQDVELICSDLDSILNNPASLAVTGQPEIFDTCVQHTVTFQDELLTTSGCQARRINRVFTVTDPMGNSAQCTQVITARQPNFNDLLPLPGLVELPCDSAFALDQNGNPHPSAAGYPTVQTHFGALPLNQALCNLGASYTDSAPIMVCDGTTRIIRRWDLLDWCAASGSNTLQLTQAIMVGDVDGPAVACPEIDRTGDGYPDPLQFSTAPYDCTAAFEAPLPNVTDNCSGWEVRTEIITDEVTPVTNQYGIITGYDTVATIIATILPGAPRYVSGIPIGCHRFRYKVTDDCNNYTILECDFCVVDDVEPTAACNESLQVSIGGQGVGRVYATEVNEGSNDNCGIDTLLVRRRFDVDPVTCDPVAPYYSDWGAYVDFSCCDVGRMISIELLVVDLYGNENTCGMEVNVADQVLPLCIAPHDVTVSCVSLPANFDPNDTSQLQALFGAAQADDGCGSAMVVEQAPVVNLNQCEVGTIIRTFQAVDLSGNLSQGLCRQVVTIRAESNYEIKFPKDFTTNCTAPVPDTLIYTSLGCDLLSVSVTDEIFTPQPGSAAPECYKIFRKYRVLNWCEYDGASDAVVIGRNEDCDGSPGDEDVWVLRRPTGTFIDRDNNHTNNIPVFGVKGPACDGTTNPTGYWRTASSVGLWEYTQIIKVIDTAPPQVSFTIPDTFCSDDPVSCSGQVVYPFTVFEDCSANGLTVEVFLDANADGVIDQGLTNTGALSGAYPNFSIQGEFPVGNHAFIVLVEDGCGNNTSSTILPFEVADCEPPAFTCLNGLSFNLMPLPPNTDFDGDGDIDIAGAAIWAESLVQYASDCSDDTIAYSINLVGEQPDINRRALYFTCEDTGTVAVQVYVWDSANNPYAVQPGGTAGGPNYGFCDTYVIVQNNNGACTSGPMMAGLVAREDDMGVEGVEVSLSGPVALMMNTAVDGSYQFEGLETGYDYTVRPYLNTGHRNGVSTFDLLILQRHLLGVEFLDSPYKRIAADANRTGSITTLDMIQIQQLILGEILEFPNNTSWRFVEKAFIFPVPTNPWFTPFPEVISVNDLAFPMMANDFVAVKIGDVNNSAVTTNLMEIEERRFAGAFNLLAPGMKVSKGEVVEVPITAERLEAAGGFQFTLELGPALELADLEYGLADENSIGLHGLANGYLTVSWYKKEEVEYAEGEPFFILHLKANADASLNEQLSISSRYTLAEAYSPGFELLDIALRFGSGKEEPPAAFRLYQNRPNPFSEGSTVGFELPESGLATLSVFDLNGRLVFQRAALFEKGYNELIMRREELLPLASGSGVMYYRLQMGDRVATRKMIILE
ncbi:MAG: DUF11 domain-containing protein [Phaeodactylibacter sp.]|nr:DUF11 domain-containing protein [Phaeodactylibacter sp.]